MTFKKSFIFPCSRCSIFLYDDYNISCPVHLLQKSCLYTIPKGPPLHRPISHVWQICLHSTRVVLEHCWKERLVCSRRIVRNLNEPVIMIPIWTLHSPSPSVLSFNEVGNHKDSHLVFHQFVRYWVHQWLNIKIHNFIIV